MIAKFNCPIMSMLAPSVASVATTLDTRALLGRRSIPFSGISGSVGFGVTVNARIYAGSSGHVSDAFPLGTGV